MSDARCRGQLESRATIVARRVGVAVAGCALFITLLAATLSRHVSCSLREPSSLTETLVSPAVIDHAYDAVLPAAWRDRVGSVLRLASDDTAIRLPEQTPLVARDVVEEVWPRDVAREQIAQFVTTTASATVTGQETTPIRLGPTASGWSALPRALLTALEELALGEELVEQLVAPLVRRRTDEVFGPLLGVSLSDAESRAASLRMLPQPWIRAQLVIVARAMVPYFAAETPAFAAIVEIRSRIPIAVEVLHEQIVEEHAARQLVLDRIVDPLIEDRLERAGPLPLDIVLSTAEIRETLLASIPPGWFARKTWVVLQAFSSYITGERDGIEFTISLAERHAAFAQLLLELLRSKLSQQLDGLPVCAGRQLFGALRALRNARRPRCVPATKRVLLDLAGPRMESEMARIVAGLPKELVLRHEDVSARLGPARMAAIDELRARVATGMVWTEEDIETLLVDAPPVVAALRRGHVEAPDLQAVAMRSADEPGQRWVALGFTVVQHPWVFEIAALVWIGIIAAMVTGPVARRVRWAASASTIAAVVAAAVLVAVRLPNPQDIGAWASFARSSWPSATAAVAGGPLPIAIAEWTHELRTTAALALLPWALVGLVARVLGASWQRGARPRRPVAAGGG